MESHKTVFQQTCVIAIGMTACAAVMVGVFALLGHCDMSVLLGAVAGGVLAVANFFVMALCTSLAADKAAAQDVKGGQMLLQLSYIGRMVGMFLIWFLCYRTGLFNLIALVLPMLFTQPIITVAELFRKSGEKKA